MTFKDPKSGKTYALKEKVQVMSQCCSCKLVNIAAQTVCAVLLGSIIMLDWASNTPMQLQLLLRLICIAGLLEAG